MAHKILICTGCKALFPADLDIARNSCPKCRGIEVEDAFMFYKKARGLL